MRIRTIALALPVVMGIAACQTSKTQGSRTARTDRQGTEASGEAQASAGGAGASGSATGSTAGTPSASGTLSTPGTTGSTSMGTGSTASSGSSDMKAHSDDQIVSGKIASVSTESITIKTLDGSDKMLQLVPETSVRVDGQDALGSDLQEGQPVRAAFNTVGDRDVAVDVRAGKGSTDSMNDSGSMPAPGSSGAGSSGSGTSSDTGSTGSTGTSSDTGSTGSGTSGTTGSDRKY